MRAGILAAAVVVLFSVSTGCNSSQLRFTTLKLSRTVPDLQERQVLDNLARVARDPGNLPYYSVVSTGTANIMDTGSGGLSSLAVQHKVFPAGVLNANASRAVTGNWTLNTTISPDRLRAMRAAYQIALGINAIDPIDLKKLQSFESSQALQVAAPGWLCLGGKHDLPKDCELVAHEGHTYVWVKPGYSKEFADFSLLILDIATVLPSSGPSGPTQINLSIDKLPPIQIGGPPKTRVDQSEAPPPATPTPPPTPGIQQRLYEDSQSINRGLFFLPR
jgi:hypothetical protein